MDLEYNEELAFVGTKLLHISDSIEPISHIACMELTSALLF